MAASSKARIEERAAGGRALAGHAAIAGGGIVGLALALALKSGLGRHLDVSLFDPASNGSAPAETRAYAIAPAARRMLEALGVWGGLAGRAQPIERMIITDSRVHDVVRPVYLTFAAEAGPGEPVAHMLEAAGLAAALREAALAAGVRLSARAVRSAVPDSGGIDLVLDNGGTARASLLVAADGRRSRLRQAADIGWVGWDYPQSGIVATVAHERDHEGRAWEHFLPAGPFAILPLPPGAAGPGGLRHRSSIVWTERREDVEPLLGLDADDLTEEVLRRFGHRLGEIALVDRPRAFPLAFGVARRFAAERLALAGDAAHVVHPLAGQGLNLGLKDAAALAEAVTEAARLGLDIGAAETLGRYERARRADTVGMGIAMDALNRLFSNDATALRLLRDLGLGLVDRAAPLKRRFMRVAAGEGERARLLRGEAL